MQGGVPFGEVLDRSDQRPGGVRDAHVNLLRRRDLALVVGVAGGHVRRFAFQHAVADGLEAQRPGDALLDILVPGLAGDFLDHRPDQHIAAVVIGPFLARLRRRRQVLELGDHFLGGVGLRGILLDHPARDVGVALHPDRMVEQLRHRRVGAGLGKIGQEFRQFVVERQFPLGRQLQHDRRRELLGDRAHAKHRLGGNRAIGGDVGQPPRAFVNHSAVVGDDDRRARPGGGIGLLQQGVRLGLEIRWNGPGRRRHRQRRRRTRQYAHLHRLPPVDTVYYPANTQAVKAVSARLSSGRFPV